MTERGPGTAERRGVGAEDVAVLARRIRAAAGGMLSANVYERLYRMAERSGGGTIVEIGTAQAAATIALARGALVSGRPFRVYSADPFDRGSRLEIGNAADNIALVRATLAAFGVEEHVTIVPGESRALAAALPPGEIAILLIDADGRIDRDLALLHPRLASGAQVAIDDVDGGVVLHRGPGGWTVDQKHRLTRRLTGIYCEAGLLVHAGTVGQTGFYRKGPARLGAGEILALAEPAYRELVFAELGPEQMGPRAAARRLAERRAPALLRLYRKLREP